MGTKVTGLIKDLTDTAHERTRERQEAAGISADRLSADELAVKRDLDRCLSAERHTFRRNYTPARAEVGVWTSYDKPLAKLTQRAIASEATAECLRDAGYLPVEADCFDPNNIEEQLLDW